MALGCPPGLSTPQSCTGWSVARIIMKSGYLLCLLEPSIHHNHRIDFHINAAEGRGLMLGISFETCGVFLTSSQFREFKI